MNTQLKASLLRFANQDLAAARKNGCMAVSQTKRGTLAIDYFPAERAYTIYPSDGSSALHKVPAKQARAYLVQSYAVSGLLDTDNPL